MRTVKELYPNCFKSSYDYPSNYQPMIDEIGNVLIQVDDDDYQGDTRVMFEKDGKYGYLIFGWGSCSGCDALQGCESYEEVHALFESMINNVKWFDSIEDLKKYFKGKDWALDYSWHQDETKDFVNRVLSFK